VDARTCERKVSNMILCLAQSTTTPRQASLAQVPAAGAGSLAAHRRRHERLHSRRCAQMKQCHAPR
jgi:hypothetical protein